MILELETPAPESSAAPVSPLLEATGLRREYRLGGEIVTALDGVDLALRPGESIAVMGPSGSGKSTLLHILGGLDPPTAGEVRLGEIRPYQLSPRKLARFRNRMTGFIFQDHCLLPQLTVLENVLSPAFIDSGTGPEDERRALELIERVGLTARTHHRPAELSGGERQRAAVARSLIRSPKLLLCDEPTGNLDPRNASAVAEILDEVRRRDGTMIVAVTHNPEFAERFGRRARLTAGRLVPES